MKHLLHPSYFPNIVTFAAILQYDVVWEVEDNFQKQTYRNRCHICNDQGKHLMSIPIRHVGGKEGRQKYKDVRVDNSYQWQRLHWRTLQTAYRTSPYFEFYEDDLAPLFEKRHKFLLDFNLKTIETLCDWLQVKMPSESTAAYAKEPNDSIDLRFLVNAKREIEILQKKYVQVFGDRHNFIKNVSTLDLLFNEGTNASSYLNTTDLISLNA